MLTTMTAINHPHSDIVEIPTSRGRRTGFAGLQAQRPLGGQRITRSEKRGG